MTSLTTSLRLFGFTALKTAMLQSWVCRILWRLIQSRSNIDPCNTGGIFFPHKVQKGEDVQEEQHDRQRICGWHHTKEKIIVSFLLHIVQTCNAFSHKCQQSGSVLREAEMGMIMFPLLSWKVMLGSNLSTCTSEQRLGNNYWFRKENITESLQ